MAVFIQEYPLRKGLRLGISRMSPSDAAWSCCVVSGMLARRLSRRSYVLSASRSAGNRLGFGKLDTEPFLKRRLFLLFFLIASGIAASSAVSTSASASDCSSWTASGTRVVTLDTVGELGNDRVPNSEGKVGPFSDFGVCEPVLAAKALILDMNLVRERGVSGSSNGIDPGG